MRPRLASAIVPTRNSDRTLEACLESLRSQTYTALEIIVVDNGSTDRTCDIAARLADRVVCAGPERSAQRNRGAALAGGEYVLFCDSDHRWEPAVVEQAVAALADPAVGAVVVPELSHGPGYWTACRALEKRLYLGDDRVEAARVYRAGAFAAAGGFDEDLTAAEDWDLHDRVVAGGWRAARTEAVVWHDEGRIRLGETFRKKRYYGRWLPRFLSGGGRRRRLARTSLLAPGPLLRAPHLAPGLFLLKAVEALGFLLGAVEARRSLS